MNILGYKVFNLKHFLALHQSKKWLTKSIYNYNAVLAYIVHLGRFWGGKWLFISEKLQALKMGLNSLERGSKYAYNRLSCLCDDWNNVTRV